MQLSRSNETLPYGSLTGLRFRKLSSPMVVSGEPLKKEPAETFNNNTGNSETATNQDNTSKTTEEPRMIPDSSKKADGKTNETDSSVEGTTEAIALDPSPNMDEDVEGPKPLGEKMASAVLKHDPCFYLVLVLTLAQVFFFQVKNSQQA